MGRLRFVINGTNNLSHTFSRDLLVHIFLKSVIYMQARHNWASRYTCLQEKTLICNLWYKTLSRSVKLLRLGSVKKWCCPFMWTLPILDPSTDFRFSYDKCPVVGLESTFDCKIRLKGEFPNLEKLSPWSIFQRFESTFNLQV